MVYAFKRRVGNTFAACLLAVILSLSARPVSRWNGAVCELENRSLKVQIDTVKGSFQVLDKTSGYLWRAAETVAGPEEVNVFPLSQPPVVDGNLADWDRVGKAIPITAKMITDAGAEGNPADIGGAFQVGWHKDGLGIAVRVTDDKIHCPGKEEGKWWYRDAVEFWIGKIQYAVLGGEWGARVWSGKGKTDGIKAAWRPRAGGYDVELFVPRAIVGSALKTDGTIRFAVGINDCDDGAKRQGQLYYPASWTHSSPSTFVPLRFRSQGWKSAASAPAPIPEKVLKPLADNPSGTVTFRTELDTSPEKTAGTISFVLRGDEPDLAITVAADPKAKISSFDLLQPLVLTRPGGRLLAPRYSNGFGIPLSDLSWRGTKFSMWAMDMPWIAQTDGTLGMLLLWDLPVSCDNGLSKLVKVTLDGKSILAPTLGHVPIRGTFGEPRTIRLLFTSSGGHVALCKRYREYARKHGILVTQREKMKNRPETAKLAGAPDMWGRCSLRFCQEAKAAGMDRMIINGAAPPDDMAQVTQQLGYLFSVYDNYEDAEEGGKKQYGMFTLKDNCMVRADGSYQKAWLTKSKPPKQYMKRCSTFFEPVARKHIPTVLEKYPYNARFLDVTPSTSLKECYSETHGLTRSEDRAAKCRLGAYVGDELGLVLGGEHGKWWGVPDYNYWEGMQSGAFYSWPAGYVGRDLPEKREAIGKRYLAWGLGEKNRYPLWELVFHDCVVSTWYWGDSTGHLHAVAPELGHRKDAFNILYGTVPLYWNSRLFSYPWDKAETRARMLESYRVTCKLHESIAFEEMLSHEFVTEDRAVQKTVFSNGTEVWVNFGGTPWTLRLKSGDWVLPEYGFYAKGPDIEQYRILPEGGKEKLTFVRNSNCLYCDGARPDLLIGEPSGPQALRFREDGGIDVLPAPGTLRIRLNPKRIGLRHADREWAVVERDAAGSGVRIQRIAPDAEGLLTLVVPPEKDHSLTLFSARQARRMREVSITDLRFEPEHPKQGQKVRAELTLANCGGKKARGVRIKLTDMSGSMLAEDTCSVPARGERKVAFDIDTAQMDGMVTCEATVSTKWEEICPNDNRRVASFGVKPNWALWKASVPIKLALGGIERQDAVACLPIDPASLARDLQLAGGIDPASLRVSLPVQGQERICPAQIVASPDGTSELVIHIPGSLPAIKTLQGKLYLDAVEAARHGQFPTAWNETAGTVGKPRYRIGFTEGQITSVSSRESNWLPFIGSICVSSAATGWNKETSIGEETVDLLCDGPVLTRIRVRKKLPKNCSYDKLYEFYPSHFVCTILSAKGLTGRSRSFYVTPCQFLDDDGHSAKINGQGGGEDIYGKNPKPDWYMTWTGDWGFSCSTLTPFDNMSYWDSNSMGGVGFTTGSKEPGRIVYTFHQTGADFDPKKAADSATRSARTAITALPIGSAE